MIIDFYRQINLSIDNYPQILSIIDLSTTFSIIDFDRHVTVYVLILPDATPGHIDTSVFESVSRPRNENYEAQFSRNHMAAAA